MRNSLLARVAALRPLALSATLLVGGINASGAVSNFPSQKITITMFGSDELPGFQAEEMLIRQWQQQHPNVSVQAQQVPLGPAFQKLSTQLPSGSGPTIFSVFEPWIEGFLPYMVPAIPAAFGLSSMRQIYDLYVPRSLDAQSRDGLIYCLPRSELAWSLLINRPEFIDAGLRIPQDVPRTWAQVAALQSKLTRYDSSGRLVRRGFGIRYTAGPQWYAMLFIATVESQGARVLDKDGNPLLTSPEAAKAMQVFQETAVAPTITKNVQTSPYQDFADGLDVMSYGGPNAISFATRLNPTLKGQVYMSQLPSVSGRPGGSPKYSFDYCVNRNASRDQQFAAWNLIDYITSNGVFFWSRTGGPSPRRNFFESGAVRGFPFMNVFYNELVHAQALPQTKHWGQLQQAIQDGVQKVVFKHEPVEQALHEMQKEYLQAIGK